ncbi:hypothetical protein [Ramlibacter alkalitolerans]|uniref:Uncharacterized protein n=1 Tax=Ramlibacter alkalitolerans TaxID=2039631 RepID=A0ABS1JX29_9BURK|nr:hypothetical protein [Ramlibacter alkalitolerans]MBL0428747.1 hypothetical protein [Ramlibacter alkalitolerans]
MADKPHPANGTPPRTGFHMIWMSLLALVMSAGLIKLGFASAMVGVLSAALVGAIAVIAALGAAVAWLSFKRQR